MTKLNSMGTEHEEMPWNPVECCVHGHQVHLNNIKDKTLFIGVIACPQCGDELPYKEVRRRNWVYFMWARIRRAFTDLTCTDRRA